MDQLTRRLSRAVAMSGRLHFLPSSGSVERQVAVGGSSIEHTSDGMERGGLGPVVRVQPLPLFLGAAA